MSLTYEQLVSRQQDLHTRIANVPENLRKRGKDGTSLALLEVRLETVKQYWEELKTNHAALLLLKDDATSKRSYFASDLFDSMEDTYVTVCTHLKELRSSLESASSKKAEPSSQSAAPAQRQLPRISLPNFSGLFNDWIEFRDLFSALVVNNSDLTDVEKMKHLKTHVQGEAADILKHLTVSNENFKPAWKLLDSHFTNQRRLISSHVSQLLTLRPVTSESAAELKRLLHGTTSSLTALKQLGRPVQHWDDLLVTLTTQKLDACTRREWETLLGADTNPPSLAELKVFLDNRIGMLEALSAASTASSPRSAISSRSSRSTSSHHVSTKMVCALCSGEHFILYCADFRLKSPEQRKVVVSEKKLCSNCLGYHRTVDCRSQKRCQQCNGNHHTMLHLGAGGSSHSVSAHHAATQSTVSSHHAAITAHVLQKRTLGSAPVLLPTALVNIADADGKLHLARALIDQGSECSFISDKLARKLRLAQHAATTTCHTVGGTHPEMALARVALNFSSRYSPEERIATGVLVLHRVSYYKPSFNVLHSFWAHLNNLQLADVYSQDQRPVELLLGVDVYAQILLCETRKGVPDAHIAQNTKLGWILSGTIRSTRSAPPTSQPSESVVSSHHFWCQPSSSRVRSNTAGGTSHGSRWADLFHRSLNDEAGGMFGCLPTSSKL